MATYGEVITHQIPDNRTVQYQDVAKPPEQPEDVPTFAAAYAPTGFALRRPQHEPAVLPPLQAEEAPTFFGVLAPDRLIPRTPSHPQPVLAPPFQTLPAPDKSWSAIYPDRLEPYRLQAGAFTQNVEPIPQPAAPDFFQLTSYPNRIPPIPPTPGQFFQNVEPIPNPPAPEGVAATFPDRLVRAEVPQPPTFFHGPNPNVGNVPLDYSRGLHVGDVRGFYHTKDLPETEPWGQYRAANNLTISHGAWTPIVLTVEFGEQGSGTSADPWKMLEADGLIRIKRDGYYVVTFDTDWGPITSGGVRYLYVAVRVALLNSTKTLQRHVELESEVLDSTSSGSEVWLSLVSRQSPFRAGQYLRPEVLITTDTGGSRLLETHAFCVRRVFSVNPVGLIY